jgi:hypothetical protein
MDDADRIKTYQGMAEVSRKWVTVLDAKAAFLVAINGALLSFIWASAKLPESPVHWVKSVSLIATGLSLISFCLALFVVYPRTQLALKASVDHVTFYMHVASKYGEGEGVRFAEKVLTMTDADLAREALEQHHAISHIALIKSVRVTHAAGVWLGAFVATTMATLLTAAG